MLKPTMHLAVKIAMFNFKNELIYGNQNNN